MSEPTRERRAHVRHSFALEGSNLAIATLGLVPRAAVLCDLSLGGVGLLTTHPPPLGAIVPLWLPGPPGRASTLVLGTILHISPPVEGLYRLGLSCSEEYVAALRAVLEEWPSPTWVVA